VPCVSVGNLGAEVVAVARSASNDTSSDDARVDAGGLRTFLE
jgi:hypothetical protein